MNISETLASMASIISIPLAIYYARKNNNITSEKARLDILKTLSYRLSDTHTLTYEDIDSVYKSKLREHEIVHANFSQEDILNDLKSDIMSNAFLENNIRNRILNNLSSITFIHTRQSFDLIPKFLYPFIRFFISPIPCILLITSGITCTVLLSSYIFAIISYSTIHNIDTFFLDQLYYDIYCDLPLCISLISLLTFSVTCFFRKKYLKKYY